MILPSSLCPLWKFTNSISLQMEFFSRVLFTSFLPNWYVIKSLTIDVYLGKISILLPSLTYYSPKKFDCKSQPPASIIVAWELPPRKFSLPELYQTASKSHFFLCFIYSSKFLLWTCIEFYLIPFQISSCEEFKAKYIAHGAHSLSEIFDDVWSLEKNWTRYILLEHG